MFLEFLENPMTLKIETNSKILIFLISQESSLKSANHAHSSFILVHGLEVDEKPKVFRCCPELIKTEVPEINFDVLPHNFCNHRRSMTNEKYHSVSFIILDRIDYLSRRTYRPLIEDQYKQLRPGFSRL